MAYFCIYPSPIGKLYLASDGEALTGLWIEGQKHFPPKIQKAEQKEDLPVFQAAKNYLQLYFEGKEASLAGIPLRPEGTAFQKRVWENLLTIPYGKTRTYKEIAELLCCGSPRAVGGAVGRNPISILIPCHRVLGSGGSLTGYAGGLENKRWLLAHEGALGEEKTE